MLSVTSFHKKTAVFILLVVAKFVLQFTLINPAYDLQRDEYLHLDQGNHLAWGYISVPPVTSWIAYVIKMLGNDVFWVRFFPALFGALTILVVWKIIEELGGNLFALILGSIAVLLSAILRVNILFQPNTLDIFFWALTYFTLIKYINTGKSKWLYAIAISVAFGFLSKYNIVFLILGLLPAILLTEHRKIFINKHFYFSWIVALIIVVPNLVWQYKNNFPTISQLQELSRTQLVHVSRIDFIKDQFLFFIGSIFLILAALIALLIYEPFKKYRCFFWSFFITLLLFIFLKAKSYYAIGLYPVLIAFGVVYLEKFTVTGWKKLLRPVLILMVFVFSLPFIFIAFPINTPQQTAVNSQRYKSLGLLRWEDGKDHLLPQDFADMIGWRDLAKKVDLIYSGLTSEKNTLVLCDNYGQAGAINYYSTHKNMSAVSLNADYINWITLDIKIENVILVQEAGDDDSARTKERPLFDKVVLVGEIDNRYSREFGTKIYLLQGAKTNINMIIADDIKKYKLNH